MSHSRIVVVQSSPRNDTLSVTRQVVQKLLEKLAKLSPNDKHILNRECAELPYVDKEFTEKITNPCKHNPNGDKVASKAWTLSWECCEELIQSDIIVIGVPIYNFSIPACLKSWIDLCTVIKRTYSFDESGPLGLLQGKSAFLVVASGGMEIGCAYDFGTRYLRHILTLWGIAHITVIDVSQGQVERALQQIEKITSLVPPTAPMVKAHLPTYNQEPAMIHNSEPNPPNKDGLTSTEPTDMLAVPEE